MNIDDYRAMKAEEAQASQEEQQSDSQGVEQTDAQIEHTPVTDTETVLQGSQEVDSTSQESGAEDNAQFEQGQTTPEFIEIDGEQVPFDELKNGYLRQGDYTRKTQELARDRDKHELATKYYDAVTQDPELAQELSEKHNLPYLSPEESRIRELESKYQDMLLEQEVAGLQTKYSDFDPQTVVKFAYDKGMANLEDAYLLTKAQSTQTAPATQEVDVAALTEQIRQQVLSEINSSVDTSSIISPGGGGAKVSDEPPTLSPQELRVAQGMKMTPTEYHKWQNKK